MTGQRTVEQIVAMATAQIEGINARSVEMGWEPLRTVNAITLTNMIRSWVVPGTITPAEANAAIAFLAPAAEALRAERAAAD